MAFASSASLAMRFAGFTGVLLAHPQEVEQQQVILAGIEPRAAPDDLAVERAHFRRSQADDAINARLVVAFGEQHRVGEHARLAAAESREDVAPVFARAVHMLRAQPALAAQRREVAAQRDEREEDEDLPMPMLGEHIGDALQVRLDGVAEILGVVVAGGRAHVVEVDLQRDRLRADRARASSAG